MIYNVTLDVVEQLTCSGSTITCRVSIDAEINMRNVAAAMFQLKRKAWSNTNVTVNIKLCVYQACVFSTSMAVRLGQYAQGKRLNSVMFIFLNVILTYH